MSIADTLFEAMYAEDAARSSAEDTIMRICGIDPEKPELWPFDNIWFDPYDSSFELGGVVPRWNITNTMAAELEAIGFSRWWFNYTDGTESYCGGKPKAVPHPRSDSDLVRRIRMGIKYRAFHEHLGTSETRS